MCHYYWSASYCSRETLNCSWNRKKKSRKKKKRREVTLEDDGKLCLKTVPWKTSYVYFRNEKLSLYKKVLRANWFFPLQPPNQSRSQRHLFFWLAPRTQFHQTCVNRSRIADFKTSFCWPKEQRALWTRLHANYNKPTNQMKHNIIEFYNA